MHLSSSQRLSERVNIKCFPSRHTFSSKGDQTSEGSLLVVRCSKDIFLTNCTKYVKVMYAHGLGNGIKKTLWYSEIILFIRYTAFYTLLSQNAFTKHVLPAPALPMPATYKKGVR